MIARLIRRIRGTATLREFSSDNTTELVMDDSGSLKWADAGTTRVAVDTDQTQTISGAKTFSGTTVISGGLTMSGATALPTGATVAAGTGSGTATLVGTLHVNTTQTTSAATAKTTLVSYALPANSLSADGKAIRVTTFGKCAANGNNKTVGIDVGGATVVSTGAVANNAGAWWCEAVVTRTGAAAQKGVGRALSVATAAATYATDTSDTTAAITIAVHATNGTASTDTIFEGLIVEMLN